MQHPLIPGLLPISNVVVAEKLSERVQNPGSHHMDMRTQAATIRSDSPIDPPLQAHIQQQSQRLSIRPSQASGLKLSPHLRLALLWIVITTDMALKALIQLQSAEFRLSRSSAD